MGAARSVPAPRRLRRFGARCRSQVLAGFTVVLVLNGLLLPRPTRAEPGPPLVSVEAKSEDVRQVLQQLATTNGINIVVDDSLTTRVTIRLQNVPLDQALQSIAKAASATVVYDGGVYLFLNSRATYTPPQPVPEPTTVQVLDLSQTDFDMALQLIRAVAGSLTIEGFPELQAAVVSGPYSQVNAVRSAVEAFLRGRPGQAAPQQQVLRVVPLSYADPYETAGAVQGQFSSVRVVPVRGSNSLVVNGQPDQVEAVVNAIKRSPLRRGSRRTIRRRGGRWFGMSMMPSTGRCEYTQTAWQPSYGMSLSTSMGYRWTCRRAWIFRAQPKSSMPTGITPAA